MFLLAQRVRVCCASHEWKAQQIGKIPEDSRETLDVPSGDDPDRADNDDHHYGWLLQVQQDY